MIEKAEAYKSTKYYLIKDMWHIPEGRTIPTVGIKKNGKVIQEKSIFPFFLKPKSFSVDITIPKPLFEKRIDWAYKRAEKKANKINKKISNNG